MKREIVICSTFGPAKAVVPFGLSNQEVGALIEKNRPTGWDIKDILSWGYLDEIATVFSV